MRDWQKTINKYNPDMITGYNIFGFDFSLKGNYIMQASKFENSGADEGLSAVDASRIARYLIDLIDLRVVDKLFC